MREELNDALNEITLLTRIRNEEKRISSERYMQLQATKAQLDAGYDIDRLESASRLGTCLRFLTSSMLSFSAPGLERCPERTALQRPNLDCVQQSQLRGLTERCILVYLRWGSAHVVFPGAGATWLSLSARSEYLQGAQLMNDMSLRLNQQKSKHAEELRESALCIEALEQELHQVRASPLL